MKLTQIFQSKSFKMIVLPAALFAGAMLVVASYGRGSSASSPLASSRPVIPLTTPIAAACPQAYASANASSASGPGHDVDQGTSTALTPTADLDARIAAATKAGTSKTKLAALYDARGDARMLDSQASPHIKYRAALEDFRLALSLDHANKDAATNKALIEAIYKGLGLPIPQ